MMTQNFAIKVDLRSAVGWVARVCRFSRVIDNGEELFYEEMFQTLSHREYVVNLYSIELKFHIISCALCIHTAFKLVCWLPNSWKQVSHLVAANALYIYCVVLLGANLKQTPRDMPRANARALIYKRQCNINLAEHKHKWINTDNSCARQCGNEMLMAMCMIYFIYF